MKSYVLMDQVCSLVKQLGVFMGSACLTEPGRKHMQMLLIFINRLNINGSAFLCCFINYSMTTPFRLEVKLPCCFELYTSGQIK